MMQGRQTVSQDVPNASLGRPTTRMGASSRRQNQPLASRRGAMSQRAPAQPTTSAHAHHEGFRPAIFKFGSDVGQGVFSATVMSGALKDPSGSIATTDLGAEGSRQVHVLVLDELADRLDDYSLGLLGGVDSGQLMGIVQSRSADSPGTKQIGAAGEPTDAGYTGSWVRKDDRKIVDVYVSLGASYDGGGNQILYDNKVRLRFGSNGMLMSADQVQQYVVDQPDDCSAEAPALLTGPTQMRSVRGWAPSRPGRPTVADFALAESLSV